MSFQCSKSRLGGCREAGFVCLQLGAVLSQEAAIDKNSDETTNYFGRSEIAEVTITTFTVEKWGLRKIVLILSLLI